jgi:hypothetical protein
VVVQEFRWGGEGYQIADNYIFFYGKADVNHHSRIGFFIHISDTISYITLKGCWCDIIALDMHAPTEDKDNNVKDSFHKELEQVFYQFPRHHMKILLGDFNAEGKEGGYF